jgi:hypothetical protein|tara:strand:+ start:1334 stop:2611 length:1278 start_codon:yes stop_codon:yes gene_type:complete
MKCRNCKKTKFLKIIKIGDQPISSSTLLKKKKLKKYPLDLFECQSCNLIQLSKVAPADKMYGNSYGYWTGLSDLMINHMKKKVEWLKKSKKILKKSRALDIGCSDPTFLKLLKKVDKSLELFAVDPSSEKFEESFKREKINLIIDYFSKQKVDNYLETKKIKQKKFSLITSFAMFYDINDPNSFCKDISNMLTKNGIWIVEFSYFPLLLKNLTFDQINHEHVIYYTLTTFNKIISKNGLEILDVKFNEINGGSAEVLVAKKYSKNKKNLKKINEILDEEKKINNNSYDKFNLRLQNVKKVINSFLDDNKKIIGYGASTKGNIILNYCEIDSRKINTICDGSEFKWNRYTPGSSIKIISKRKMRKIKPDYLFILIWSFRSEVIKQEKKFIMNGGKLIIPLPIFHIIDKNNYKYFVNKELGELGYSI